MNAQPHHKTQYKKHFDRFSKLEDLLNKIDYATLGEDSEMRSEYLRLRAKVVEEMREEKAMMDSILQQAMSQV